MAHRESGDGALAVDLATIVAVSVAICSSAHDLARMRWLVPTLLLARTVAWLSLPASARDGSRAGELVLLLVATAFGAFNDWSSVVRHRIYDYTVPTDLGGFSSIPSWMLLYWGMILRFVLTLSHARRLGLPPLSSDLRGRGGVGGRALVLLGMVVLTRQGIYRLYDRPLLSFLPFAAALGVYLAVFVPDARRRRLLAAVIVLGPAVEVLYIRVGHLHAYHQGLLFGVPVWIALWWGLAVLVWEELGTRLMDAVERALGPRLAGPGRST